MIATASEFDRANRTRQKLNQLREMGYKFITTRDDGDTWIPSADEGLEIDRLIESVFMGEILIKEQ